jgi:hypothetical protein
MDNERHCLECFTPLNLFEDEVIITPSGLLCLCCRSVNPTNRADTPVHGLFDHCTTVSDFLDYIGA